MKFILEIELDNDAFEHNGHTEPFRKETARILRRCAEDVADNAVSGKLMDINGNSVGHFEFTK